MISDIFWNIATSSVVLCAIGAVLIAAFIVSHTPSIVQRFWPQAYAYAKAAALVQVIAAALLFFLVGFRVSDERAENRQLKVDLAFTELQIENAKATARDAEQLKAEAEEKAKKAEGLLDDFRTHIKSDAGAGCGWTDDEFGRLRNLRGSKRR